jgi:hypothetical protein
MNLARHFSSLRHILAKDTPIPSRYVRKGDGLGATLAVARSPERLQRGADDVR